MKLYTWVVEGGPASNGKEGRVWLDGWRRGRCRHSTCRGRAVRGEEGGGRVGR